MPSNIGTKPRAGAPQFNRANQSKVKQAQKAAGVTRGPQAKATKGSVQKNIVSSPVKFVPKGAANVKTSVGNELVNVRGLQHFLNGKGYNVTVDGKLGAQTRSALRDAVLTGRIHNPSQAESSLIHGMHGQVLGPKDFDKMVSTAGTPPYKPLTGKGGLLDKSGNSAGNAMGGAGGGSGGGNSLNVAPTQNALKASAGSKIPTSDADFGQLFDVDAAAQAMANEQYQPQINDAQLQVNKDPVQAAQNEKDVSDWYNQVIAAQQQAGTQDQALGTAGVSSLQGATQALVNSLGGSANQGAGEAAAAGQNASGTLQAIAASQGGLDNELAPILAAQATQQKTNQKNLDQQTQQNDQESLSNLQGQRGNAETSAQQQLQESNNSLAQARNSALQNILQYNNSLSQQKYQNQLGLLSTEAAAEMNGVNIAKAAAQANYYNSKAAGGSGKSASQINAVQKQLIAALGSKGLIVSPSAGVYKLAPGVTPGQVLGFSKNFDQSYNGLPSGFAGNTLSAIEGY